MLAGHVLADCKSLCRLKSSVSQLRVSQAQRKRAAGSDVKLVLAGCVAQQEGAALLRRVPELDLVMGPQHANQCVLCTDWCLS